MECKCRLSRAHVNAPSRAFHTEELIATSWTDCLLCDYIKKTCKVVSGAHGDAHGGVIDEQLSHEVHAGGLQGGEVLLQGLRAPVGELVPVAQLAHASPLVLLGRAQQLEDVQQLPQLAVPREQRHLRAPAGTLSVYFA